MPGEPCNGTPGFDAAERRLFAACGLEVASRRLTLADPPLDVRVLETGDGASAGSRSRQRHVCLDVGATDVAP